MTRKCQRFHSAGIISLKFSTGNELCGYVAVLKGQVVEVTPDGPRILYFNSSAKCSQYWHVVNVCMSRHMCFVLPSRQNLLGSIYLLNIKGAKMQVSSQNHHLFDISLH